MSGHNEITVKSTILELDEALKTFNLNAATMIICSYADTMKRQGLPIFPTNAVGAQTADAKMLEKLLSDSYQLCYAQCQVHVDGANAAMIAGEITPETFNESAHAIRFDFLQSYVMIFTATRYAPYGNHIQQMADEFLTYFKDKTRLPSQNVRDVMRKFVELALEAYDQLATFLILLDKYPQFVTIEQKTKALAIAHQLKKPNIIKELQSKLMSPPKGWDQDEHLDEEQNG